MEDIERNFIEIENLNGEIEQAEVVLELDSKRDDKHYVILSTDKEIGDVVNINIAYVYNEDGKTKIKVVEDMNEINYVTSLISEQNEEVDYEL